MHVKTRLGKVAVAHRFAMRKALPLKPQTLNGALQMGSTRRTSSGLDFLSQ
jgi:hypothetical protein